MGLKINIFQPDQIAFWTREFQCTEKELRCAVIAVGNKATEVEKYLKWDFQPKNLGKK